MGPNGAFWQKNGAFLQLSQLSVPPCSPAIPLAPSASLWSPFKAAVGWFYWRCSLLG